MLNVKNYLLKLQKNTPAVKLLGFIAMVIILMSLKKHPNHIGIVDVKYTKNSFQIITKLNINDLETALRKTSALKIDILNDSNKTQNDSVLYSYIKKRLQLTINGKLKKLNYIGFEREDENIITYLEIPKLLQPKNIKIDCKLLYDYLHHQTNIIHTEVAGKKQSKKITKPESKVEFVF